MQLVFVLYLDLFDKPLFLFFGWPFDAGCFQNLGMADWRDRSEMNGDVVFFRYVSEGMEKSHEEVFLWDLDKTYLDTTIDSLSGLMTTILNAPLNKKNIPGTNVLLQSLSEFRKQQRLHVFPDLFHHGLTAADGRAHFLKNSHWIISARLGAFIKTIWRTPPGTFLASD